jgi:hypothetical protein
VTLTVAVAWGGAGVILWTRGRRISAVMIAFGVSWLLGDLDGAFLFLHRGPLAQFLLAYPDGRLAAAAVGAKPPIAQPICVPIAIPESRTLVGNISP